ncbi:MAG: hypothetical protein ACRDA7_01225, partial [Metamycoplasmataceae bacterium]
TTPPVDKTLNITVKSGTITLKDSDITNLQGSDNANKLESLKKLFDGTDLTIINLVNFETAVNTTNTIVTLTAKSGFTFASGKTLTSNKYTLEPTPPAITNLNISARGGAIIIAMSDITDLQGNNADKKLAALQKLFQGSDLTLANLSKFTTSVNTSQRKVTLTPIKDHTIDNKNTLESNSYNINLAITPKRGNNIVITPQESLNLDWFDNTKKLETLKKLFDGSDLTMENLDKFNIEIIQVVANATIRLNVKTGYTFSGKAFIERFTDLSPTANANIIRRSSPPLLTPTQVSKLKEAPIVANQDDQLTLLSRLFEGINSTNQRFFKIEVNENTKTITLHAKPGFVIGTTNTSTVKFVTATYTS